MSSAGKLTFLYKNQMDQESSNNLLEDNSHQDFKRRARDRGHRVLTNSEALGLISSPTNKQTNKPTIRERLGDFKLCFLAKASGNLQMTAN